MTDDITKFLRKLSAKERDKLEVVRQKLQKRDFKELDIKPLRGHKNMAQIRVGRVRIVFKGFNEDPIRIIKITFRDDQTYRL